MELAEAKAGESDITKVPRECAFWRGFWQEEARARLRHYN